MGDELKNKVIGMKSEMQALELAVKCNLPCLLEGETGIGKTYIVRNLAEVYGKKLIRINLNGETGVSELIGKFLLKDSSTYWQDGILVEALRNGWWVVLDEINAALPEILFILNSLLDDEHKIIVPERNNEVIFMNSESRIFATCNPSEEYRGTKELSKSLLSRFAVKIEVDYPEPETEMEILTYHENRLDKDEAKLIVDIANIIRKMKEEDKTTLSVGTRDLVYTAKLFCADGMTLSNIILLSILNKAPKADRELIANTIIEKLCIEFPTTLKKGELKSLLGDYKKSVDELEKEKDSLKMNLRNIEQKIINTLREEIEKMDIYNKDKACVGDMDGDRDMEEDDD